MIEYGGIGLILEEIQNTPPDLKAGVIAEYARAVDGVLTETFDTGVWFQDMLALKEYLSRELEAAQNS